MRSILKLTLIALLLIPGVGRATSDDWPSTKVKYEDLHPLTRFKLLVPYIVVKGRVSGPSIIKAHISSEGAVVRTALLSSCGNSDLDEAAMHAMREMRFEPYEADGEPTDVSLLLPIHIPKNFGRRD
jgi:TonB family protein